MEASASSAAGNSAKGNFSHPTVAVVGLGAIGGALAGSLAAIGPTRRCLRQWTDRQAFCRAAGGRNRRFGPRLDRSGRCQARPLGGCLH